jgi:hypothetical protein
MIADDERMPWTRDRRTDEQLRQWVASRKEAGRMVDIQTCEIGEWYSDDLDPYGVEPTKRSGQTGKWLFVRSTVTNGWVSEGDLPKEKAKALYARLDAG